jgi:hypothetical protein
MQDLKKREKITPELLRDRSAMGYCPQDTNITTIIYFVGPEDFLSGKAPSYVIDNNHFREFPCRYCVRQERSREMTEEGIQNNFKCNLHKGKVIEKRLLSQDDSIISND